MSTKALEETINKAKDLSVLTNKELEQVLKELGGTVKQNPNKDDLLAAIKKTVGSDPKSDFSKKVADKMEGVEVVEKGAKEGGGHIGKGMTPSPQGGGTPEVWTEKTRDQVVDELAGRLGKPKEFFDRKHQKTLRTALDKLNRGESPEDVAKPLVKKAQKAMLVTPKQKGKEAKEAEDEDPFDDPALGSSSPDGQGEAEGDRTAGQKAFAAGQQGIADLLVDINRFGQADAAARRAARTRTDGDKEEPTKVEPRKTDEKDNSLADAAWILNKSNKPLRDKVKQLGAAGLSGNDHYARITQSYGANPYTAFRDKWMENPMLQPNRFMRRGAMGNTKSRKTITKFPVKKKDEDVPSGGKAPAEGEV
jgi:hypothetical protein